MSLMVIIMAISCTLMIPAPRSGASSGMGPGPDNPVSCVPGLSCIERYNSLQFGTYGNSGFWAVGDCTYASAANWEIVVLGKRPKLWLWNLQIPFEFKQHTGQFHGGITMSELFSTWQTYGIEGTYLRSAHWIGTSRSALLNALPKAKAIEASLSFSPGQWFGPYQVPTAGGHAILVDGVSPIGPIIVSWGMTLQMTWAQWNAEADGAWVVTAA